MLTSNQRDILAGICTYMTMKFQELKDSKSLLEYYTYYRNAIEELDSEGENDADINTDSVD